MRWPALLLLPTLALAGELPGTPAPAEATVDPASVAPPAPAVALAPTSAPPTPAWAARLRADGQAVLKGEDFHRTEVSRGIAPREWLRRWLSDDEQKDPDKPFDFSFLALAQALKWLVIALLVLALAWLLWRGWQWLAPQVGRRGKPVAYTPLEAQSLALAREELPEGVSSAARAAWQRGDSVLALSLLYRGAVKTLEDRYAIRLPDSATEGECLRLARRSGKAVVTEGFAPIVRAWIALAYARQLPEDFDRLAALYARHFETGATAGARV